MWYYLPHLLNHCNFREFTCTLSIGYWAKSQACHIIDSQLSEITQYPINTNRIIIFTTRDYSATCVGLARFSLTPSGSSVIVGATVISVPKCG